MMLTSAFEIQVFAARFDVYGVGTIVEENGKPKTFYDYQAADAWIQKQNDTTLSPVERYLPRIPQRNTTAQR